MSDGTLSELGMREPRERTNHDAIRNMVESAVTNSGVHWSRIAEHWDVLMCERPDRTGEGFKPLSSGLQGGAEEKPWEADVDVPLAERVLSEMSDLLMQGMQEGRLQATPVAGAADALKAGYANMEMHHYLNGPLAQDMEGVAAEAAWWTLGFGSYLVGLGWRRRKVDEEAVLVLAELHAWTVEQGSRDFMDALQGALAQGVEVSPAEGEALSAELESITQEVTAELEQAIFDRDQLDELAAVLLSFDPNMCEGEPRRVARALQRGETEVPYCYYRVVVDSPYLTGLRPGIDILIPEMTRRANEMPWAAEPVWGTAAEMRSLAASEGWDPAWLEEFLKNGASVPYGLMDQYGTQYPWIMTGATVGQTIGLEARQDYFCAIRFTYRATSRAGGESVYQCLVHDGVEGMAYHTRLRTWRGLMPYEDFRAEPHQRLLLASRGVIGSVESAQEQMRMNMNAYFDYVQKFVNPVVLKPDRFSQENVRSLFRPGADFTYGRRDQVPQYMTPPVLGAAGLGREMHELLERDVAKRFALLHPEVPAELSQAKWQQRVNAFGQVWGRVLKRVYALIQEFGPEEVTLRVTESPRWLAATGQSGAQRSLLRSEIDGEFDFSVYYDTRGRMLDWAELRAKVWAATAAMDVDGRLPRNLMLASLVATVDPQAASRILTDDAASAQETQKTLQDWNTIVAGGEPPLNFKGRGNAQGVAMLEQLFQSSPLAQQYLQNPQIQQVTENYLKMRQQEVMQEENKQIGRTGGRPVLSGGLAGNGK